MKFTKIVSMLLIGCMMLGLVACGAQEVPETSAAPEITAAPAETEAAAEAKPVLLAVSFGTSYNETRALTIDAVEAALQEAYPAYEVRRAFTSQIVIDILE